VVLKTYKGGQAAESASFSGRLLGGCMDCLVNLTGTGFDRVSDFKEKYKNDGIVWFLESCDLNVMSIRRAMWHMEQAGWFENAKGFLIGRPLVFGQEMMGLDQYEAVLGILRKYNVPVVMDVNFGHLPPAMPIVCGSVARVDVSGSDFKIEMKLV
jgi:muramoyltetrapeptide carboxypeptidase LdcA involved in peptidoglycan recycling